MNSLWTVPILTVASLSPERAVSISRAILRSECAYAKLGPAALTISDKLMTPDGGIDAEVNVPHGHNVNADCIFQFGITGFQIKAGTTFKPWKLTSIRQELLSSKGELNSEVKRLVERQGRYSLICTGHDLTPEQRNNSKELIVATLAEKGFEAYESKVEVFGASQITEFAERYPGVASLLSADPIQEAWTLDEWQHDAHMANDYEESSEQTEIITQLRSGLQAEAKHIRILGEPGLGKTRIVLEALNVETISPHVLYIQHGSQFGQTKLFRQLVKSGRDKPLILVIDELPEMELSDIWRHLKPRCGQLKIVSMDHGQDETRDEDIDRIQVPYLPDDIIKKILIRRIGESHELDRWISICEGSPRVAQAVADNLYANPSDLLKPPATVPIWTRFLHGYGKRDEIGARQVECVAQHIALFNRFGYEAPVGEEAAYIAELVRNVDPTIGWARFQEIIKNLRARRVLQGSRTLFFVPKALHIYLWKQFWECYGRGFDFNKTFLNMPKSLHAWFLNMFKYAGEASASHVINDILKSDGIFSKKEFLESEKGSRFLSILAEANPSAVLKLLEATIGKWTNDDLLSLSENRQNFVWTLEKIAVWPAYTTRALNLLIRLAVNENSHYSNNSTGTLVGLFRIGPEWAATESTPETRLSALLQLLRSSSDVERLLGLKIVEAALDTRGGFRTVGPEYQGLKERAKLWIPETYGEWWQAYFTYFQALVNETKNWPSRLRRDVCNTLFYAVEEQIRTPPCTELAFQVMNSLVKESAMLPEKLNKFFWNWRAYKDDDNHPEITKRLQLIERQFTRRDLVSRFNRYVIDVDWMEWDEDFRDRHNKPKNRSKLLVSALAKRIVRYPEKLSEIRHLLAPEKGVPALWFFGEKLEQYDADRCLLPELIKIALETKHQVCLHGYLSEVGKVDPELYGSVINNFLDVENTAWLGVTITLSSDYRDALFSKCLIALENNWVSSQQFNSLRYGRSIDKVPQKRIKTLLDLLKADGSEESFRLLIELLDSTPLDGSSPIGSEFVFDVLSRSIPGEEGRDPMKGYHWKNVCQKLIKWDDSRVLPLLECLLNKMGDCYRLSYDSYVEPLASELVRTNPSGAWNVIKTQLEETLPQWRSDILNWLKGGLSRNEESNSTAAISELPISQIVEWIDEDPKSRAALIAHAAPPTLDDSNGGKLTRIILQKYSKYEGVNSGISCNFHSGSWSGLTSSYLKKKRDKFRRWLGAGFESEVSRWIESEIEYLDKNIEREEIDEERSRFD
ncbi:MAG: hypothetical protein OEZ43_01250 [Gammaproteobacteria bacterium]|nr:hypothetical protein [Gammaproteobacteria bacterium]